MGAFAPFEIPPGVTIPPTKASKSIHWTDTNLIRWGEEGMSQIGGWERFAFDEPLSTIRLIHEWADNSNRRWVVYLCDAHVYVEYENNLVDITPVGGMTAPAADATSGGYGDNVYNLGAYNTARPPEEDRKKVGHAYSIDNWGENLLVMTSYDGRLIQWVPPAIGFPPDPAEVVAEAPTGRLFVVTPERFVLIFDYNGLLGETAWCDQENITNWNFADVTSKAGTIPVEPRAITVAAKRIAGRAFFITTQAAYVMNYTGVPYIYAPEEISGGTVPVSNQSLVDTPQGAIWPTDNGWWRFNGVSISPIGCPVWKFITDNIDWDYSRFLSFTHINVGESELWWFFSEPGLSSPTKAVIYNFRDGWWAPLRMSRTAGSSRSYIDYPLMANDRRVYRHEFGSAYADYTLKPFAESFQLNPFDGADLITVRQIMPEVQDSGNNVRFSLLHKLKRTPNLEVQTPLRQIQSQTGCVDFMLTSRDIRLRVDSIAPGFAKWSFGQTLMDIVQRGRKP